METNAREIQPQGEPIPEQNMPPGNDTDTEETEVERLVTATQLPTTSEIRRMDLATAEAASGRLSRDLESTNHRREKAGLELDAVSAAWEKTVEIKKRFGLIPFRTHDPELDMRRDERIREVRALEDRRTTLHDLLRELDIRRDDLDRAERKRVA
jgi:hypothetical protein